MIKIEDLTLFQGAQLLIEHANIFIAAQQKVGILGANGSGKTSLFNVILDRLESQTGKISIPNGIKIAHIEQTIPSLEETATLYVMRSHPEYHHTYMLLFQAEEKGDMEKVALHHAHLGEINGYFFKSQVEKVLLGLGFDQQQLKQKISTFSGGWRMRLHLARCLLVDAELLLLDEPTNHLDLNGILWLQNWLKQYKGTLLLISHDRDFLDDIVTHILHLHQHHLQLYTGNYTRFTEQRAEALAQQSALYKKQQLQIKHMMLYVSRFRYKSSKAKQAQSRLKAIDRMEKIPPILEDQDFILNFQQPELLSNPLMTIHKLSMGYDNNILLKNINLSIENQSRIGLIGVNGAGKSTFLKALTQETKPIEGEINFNHKLKIGYFSQHQVESFNPEHTCFHVMQLIAPQLTENQIRSYLGMFGFSGEKALAKTNALSGGEKARLALAKIFWQKPNILLLDEPTNHLDLMMRDALNLALQAYQGAIVLISHDRYLLRSIVDELWIAHQGTVKVFDGDLEDYSKIISETNDSTIKNISGTPNVINKPPSLALQRKLNLLERRIQKIQSEIQAIEMTIVSLSEGDLRDEKDRLQLREQTLKKQKLMSEMEELEDQWCLSQE